MHLHTAERDSSYPKSSVTECKSAQSNSSKESFSAALQNGYEGFNGKRKQGLSSFPSARKGVQRCRFDVDANNFWRNCSCRMASYNGFIIVQYQFKNLTFHFLSSFLFLPPSICKPTGNCSLRGGCVNPAGHGKPLLPTAAGWPSHAPKPRQNTESLRGPSGMQPMTGAYERRKGKGGDGRM